MVAIKTLWTAVLLAGVALVESKACKKPLIRREWYETFTHPIDYVLILCRRSLSLKERDLYIKAQKCLIPDR